MRHKCSPKRIDFSDISLTTIRYREPLRRGGGVIAILDLSKTISRKRWKIGGKLVLITIRKSYINFRLVPKSVTLDDLERRNGPSFALFHRVR